MRPRRLTLRGLTRFTTEIAMDLDQLPAGLIAVAGSNGSGKTTIMEAMGPGALFLELPSRPGILRDRVNRRDAFLELVQDYRGETWRHLIQVDPGTGTSGAKTEAYLWRLAPGAELPAPGEPTPEGTWIDPEGYPTTGRIGDYTGALEGLGFPARDVFLAGAFAVHTGAGNFLELDTAGRKALFVTLLGLQGYQDLADRAAAARKPLDGHLAELEDLAAQLERDRQAAQEIEAEASQLGARVAELQAEVGGLEAQAGAKRDQVAKARAELDTLEGARRVIVERRQELEAEAQRLEARAAELQELIAGSQELERRQDEIRAQAARHQELTERRATLLGERAGHLATRDAVGRELTTARQELGRLGETRPPLEAEGLDLDQVARALEGVRDRQRVAGSLSEDRAALDATRQELAKARPLAVAAETRHREDQAKAPSLEATRARLERLERDAQLQEGVPCGGRVLKAPAADRGLPVDCGACAFLIEARRAAGELPGTRKDLEDAEAAAEDLAALWAHAQALRATVAELEARQDRQAQGVQALELLEAEAARLQDRLGRRPVVAQELEANGARSVALLTVEIPEIEARQAKAAEDLDKVEAEGRRIRAELDGDLVGAPQALETLTLALARLPERRQALEDGRQALKRTRAALLGLVLPPEPLEARQRLAELEEGQRDAAHLVAVVRTDLDAARERLGHARGRLAEVGDLEARAQALEATRASLGQRRAGFREIERALGRSGVQVLEIDAAGPTVARLTNDLLAATFGGRFAVRLDTMTEGGQGRKVRETFDLVVLDGNRKGRAEDSNGGGRKAEARERLSADVSELSKGEKVLVDEALKLAIAMFHAQRTGAPILTLWRDECDTGLDPENRRRYPAMLRRALELGGFDRLYFVSHDPDVQAQADAVIRVAAHPSEIVAFDVA